MMVTMISLASKRARSQPARAPNSAPPRGAPGEQPGQAQAVEIARGLDRDRGRDGADHELPVRADIVDIGAERDRDAEAENGERDRARQHLIERIDAAERAADHHGRGAPADPAPRSAGNSAETTNAPAQASSAVRPATREIRHLIRPKSTCRSVAARSRPDAPGPASGPAPAPRRGRAIWPDLAEGRRDQENGQPGIAALHQLPPAGRRPCATSRPRVGCAAISTRALPQSSRPTTSFC